jgi:hypothetical protein
MPKAGKPGSKGTEPPRRKDRTAHNAARGRKQPKLADLSSLDLSSAEFAAAMNAMRDETDRGSAIIGCALVEEGLTNLLRAKIVNHDSYSALFSDKDAPFQTLKSKTVVSYALGLIYKQTSGTIDTIRNIRNQFSHALRAIGYHTAAVNSACIKLPDYHLLSIEDKDRDLSPSRWKYESACVGVYRITLIKTTELMGLTVADLQSVFDKLNPESAGLQGGNNDVLSDIDPN